MTPWIAWIWLLAAPVASPAEAPAPAFDSYEELLHALTLATSLPAPAQREAAVDRLWAGLVAAEQIPFRAGRRVVFLYRDTEGTAREVAWRGDMNGWDLDGTHMGWRLGESSLWMLEEVLPLDARLDYKLFVNGGWRLDEANPHQQLGGYGPNSELRMPDYRPPPEVEERADVPKGTLGPMQRIRSEVLGGYDVDYQVYTPAGYEALSDLPVVYATDGGDYSHPGMGRMTTVLDNRIADGTLPAMLAVFIDPHDPRTGDTRRQREYGDEPASYARFLVEELVPALDAAYRTRPRPAGRVILGTSLGGLFAAHVVLHHSDAFGGALIQSPAFGFDGFRHDNRLMKGFRTQPRLPVRIFIDAGTLYDELERGRDFYQLLVDRDYAVRRVEVNEGHSWGHWRAWLDDGLAFLLAPEAP